MIKLCVFTFLLGLASAGFMVYENEAKECDVNKVATFTMPLNEYYRCPTQYLKNATTPGKYYCADPSCPTAWHDFYEESYLYKLVCCHERCETADCGGALVKKNSCKVTLKARTSDYGQTWQCKESFYPKCPGGNVVPCDANCRKDHPNNTITVFGEELWCDSLSCITSGKEIHDGVMVLDKESWSWKCVNKKRCSTGDFMMKLVNVGTSNAPVEVWRCISETCPAEKHEYDKRRGSTYCQADLDCISESLSWNYNKKSWECPSERTKTTIESRLEELMIKVNEIDQKINTLMKKN